MKKLLVSVLVAGAVAVAGCNNTSGTGGVTHSGTHSGTGSTSETRHSSYNPAGTPGHGTVSETRRSGFGPAETGASHGTTQAETHRGGAAVPAETGRGAAANTGNRSGREETFTLSGPNNLLPLAIKQGERKEVTVKVNRGTDFKEPVTLRVENPPKGLTVKPENGTVAAGSNEDKVWIEAAKDAPLGEQTIDINGVPGNGAATGKPLQIKVKVEKGG